MIYDPHKAPFSVRGRLFPSRLSQLDGCLATSLEEEAQTVMSRCDSDAYDTDLVSGRHGWQFERTRHLTPQIAPRLVF